MNRGDRVFGPDGILSLLRTAELIATGNRTSLVLPGIGIVAVFLAWRSLMKARQAGQKDSSSAS